MVLTARAASLFPSRAPSFLASVFRPGRLRAALHTAARTPGPLSRSTFRASRLGPLVSTRLLTTPREKVKVLAVLYDGGVHAEQVPGLLGTTENELGIRKWLEEQGHTLVTTSDKEGENSTFDRELVDAEIIITTPYADF